MQTLTDTPPSDLVFQVLPYECEVTEAVTAAFEKVVDRALIQAACEGRSQRGVDIYLARDGSCYGRVAQSRTYAIELSPTRAPLVANWIQRS